MFIWNELKRSVSTSAGLRVHASNISTFLCVICVILNSIQNAIGMCGGYAEVLRLWIILQKETERVCRRPKSSYLVPSKDDSDRTKWVTLVSSESWTAFASRLLYLPHLHSLSPSALHYQLILRVFNVCWPVCLFLCAVFMGPFFVDHQPAYPTAL